MLWEIVQSFMHLEQENTRDGSLNRRVFTISPHLENPSCDRCHRFVQWSFHLPGDLFKLLDNLKALRTMAFALAAALAKRCIGRLDRHPAQIAHVLPRRS